jgi:predicted O-linked N-acetylglucosamine transferase (SPINDLY family)
MSLANPANTTISSIIDQALKDHAEGRQQQAMTGFQTVLQHDSGNVVALYMLGAMHSEREQYQAALQYLNHAIAVNGQFAQSYQARSVIYSKLGHYKSAFHDTQTALRLDPQLEDARKNYDTLQLLAENTAPSKASAVLPIKATTKVTPRANPLSLVELIEQTNRASTHMEMEQTIRHFQDFLINGEASQAHLALFSIGVLHHKLNRNHDAEAYFRHALLIKPDFFACHLNLGLLLERNNRTEQAVTQWELALQLPAIDLPEHHDDKLKITTNLGRLLEVLNDYERAENALREALRLDPDNGPVLHHWIHLRQKQCRWPITEGLNRPDADVLASASPIAMLGLSDDPAAQLAAGRHFVKTKVESHPRMVPFRHDYGHQKLRIGYLSSNLSMHAVSLLTVELYETHDRNLFETHAFCWSPEDGTAFRQRVKSAFDHVHAVGGLTDEQTAELIRSKEIDIIVDLQGLTSGARPNIVARGPAPVQVAYLGYPGPSALPYVDYIVADSFIMPPELCPHFTEKPLYLPGLFQVSDRKRQISAVPPRSQFGFDEGDFIFCAFNNNHKFTPELFGSWMRILRATPHSVLWLLEDNQWSKANLLAAAAAHGVAKQRLRFAGRITPADYLARFAVADLFLDTMPYNAGTTANDALWAGLPLLTLSGHTYVSRMAGSLLKSIGLDELIAFDTGQYEKTAIRLANNPHEIKTLRDQLHQAKEQGKLFNTDRFTREFEAALQAALKGQD